MKSIGFVSLIGIDNGSPRASASSSLHAHIVLDQSIGMLDTQMGPQCVDAAVGGRAIGAHRALRGVRVKVVPAVGHFLAAGPAAPHRAGQLPGGREHVVIGHLVVVMRMVVVMGGCSCCGRGRDGEDAGRGVWTSAASRAADRVGAHQGQVVVGTGAARTTSEHRGRLEGQVSADAGRASGDGGCSGGCGCRGRAR